ncbi:adenylyltransferase/cytidyltransferase family protein [Methanosphaera sp. WGK6]|uniref:adenylyltransferase/cytidyltransferase family protein n=1 Tax=Methanosphaera sp. WGK6 TaxID=1561964 RepID=UPI00084C3A91|nr:adenylyltransferase/cytidyltransferase family protein [Methanosphaera sp. WGK6]OED30065.1 FAD synthase [Methanosphaera sp. WGK6]
MASGTFDIIHPGHGFYLQEAKKLGGEDSILMVVIATDKTVQKHKRIPIISQEQRCEMISMLKSVDEAYIGDENDPLKIVKEKKPDIIAIGPDQTFDPEKLRKNLLNSGLDIEVVKIEDYKKFELDSTCKIIRKIKKTHFNEDAFQDCND